MTDTDDDDELDMTEEQFDAMAAEGEPVTVVGYEALAASRNEEDEAFEEAMRGRVRGQLPGVDYDCDFYEEDEPVDKIIAAFEASEKHLTEPPPFIGPTRRVDLS